MRLLQVLFLAVVMAGCASDQPTMQASDVIAQGLIAPKEITSPGTEARYWAFNNFVVHIVTNINEQNKTKVPIIYVHGLGGNLTGFAPLINLMHRSRSGRPFYALDLPPFGESIMRNANLTIHDYTEMLQEFIAQLGVPKVNLVCHSMGGQVCIDYALANPGQIQLLTLISPAGTYEKSPFVNGATNHFVGINVGSVDAPNTVAIGDLSWYDQGFARRMLTDNPLVLIGIESFRLNFHNRIQKLKTQTLIIWGRNDQIFDFINGAFLKENVENSVFYVIDGADHTSFRTHSDVIAKLIQKYL